MDITRSLLENAKRFPDSPALSWGGISVTYEEMARTVGQVSAELAALGFSRGDFGLLSMDGSREAIALQYAMTFLGMISVPINPALPESGIKTIISKTQPALSYLPHRFLEANRSSLSGIGTKLQLTDESSDDATFITASKFLERSSRPERGPDVFNLDVVLVLFTTGTSGDPKGTKLTLANVSAAAEGINQFTGLRASDIEIISLPMYHSFGLGRLRCILHAGCKGYVIRSMFRPEVLLKAIADEKATVFAQVPAGFRLLMLWGERVRKYTESVRMVEIGSAPMTVEEKRRVLDLLPGARICHHYGLTEASRSLFMEYSEAERLGKLDSIGRPSPNVAVKLVKSGDYPENTGLIAIKGPHVSTGYIGDLLKEGLDWLTTEDIGRIDEDGYYYYVGRTSDVINIGGYKVYPTEVESVLDRHADLSESAVTAGSSQDVGRDNQIIAFIVPHKRTDFSERDVREHLKTRLEAYKIPSKFVLVDSLPRTESGKLQRWKLINHLST